MADTFTNPTLGDHRSFLSARRPNLLVAALIILVCGALLLAAAKQKYFWDDEVFTATYAQSPESTQGQYVSGQLHPPMYYSTLALCVALTTQWYQRSGHWLFLISYLLSAATFVYLLFSAASVLLAANLLSILFWWYGRRHVDLRSTGARRRTTGWAHLSIWLLAQVAVPIMVIPSIQLMLSVNEQTGGLALGGWTSCKLLIEVLKRLGYFGFIFSVGETLSPLNPLAWVGLLATSGLMLYALIAWRKAIDFWLHVFMVGVIFVSNFMVTFQGFTSMTWQNLPHRIFFLLPFPAIWLGAALARMRPCLALVAGGMLLLVYTAGIFNYFTGRQYIRPALTVPWAEVFDQIHNRSGPEATVICSEGDKVCAYYAKGFGFDGFGPDKWSELSNNPPVEL